MIALFRSAGSEARWRSERLAHWDLLHRMLRKGLQLSPLMSAPCLRSRCFKVDWLHVVDLGVAADFAANLFAMVLPMLPGAAEKERCNQLFRMICAYYTEHKVESRLGRLTPTMIAPPGKSPKLRAHAAETRGLIKFARLAAVQ